MLEAYQEFYPKLASGVFVHETAVVIGRTELGKDASVWPHTVIRGDVMPITIGARTNIQDLCVVHVTTAKFATLIEEEVTVGHGALLHGCTIRRRCLIGMGSRVLDGCEIGEESIIGAGAVLTPGTIVPPHSLVLGFPAKVKRPLTPEEIAGLQDGWQSYFRLKNDYLAARNRP